MATAQIEEEVGVLWNLETQLESPAELDSRFTADALATATNPKEVDDWSKTVAFANWTKMDIW